MNMATKIYGLLLGGLAASPSILIGAWGLDVYLANKENDRRIASRLETTLGLKSNDLSLESTDEECQERGQFRYKLFSEGRTEGEVCLELKAAGCRSVHYEECPRMLEVGRVQRVSDNL